MPKINFDITGDNSNMVKALEETRQRMSEVSKTIEQVGDGLDLKSVEEKIEVLNEAISTTEEYIEECMDNVKEYTQQAEEAAKSGDFDAADKFTQKAEQQAQYVENATETLHNYKDALDMLTNGISSTAEAEEQLSDAERQHEGIMVKLLGGTENFNTIMRGLPAPLQSAISGLNGMTGAAKAFIATPLGAIIAAIVLALQTLKMWFTNTSEGQMALTKITGYLSGAMTVLRDIAIDIGEKLFKAFSDPKQAVKDLWNAIKDNIVTRMEGLGGMFVNFGKIVKASLTLNFDEAKEHFDDFNKSLLQVATGRQDFVSDLKAISEAVSDTVKNIKEEADETAQLNARLEQLHRDESKWAVDEAKLDKQIADARSKMYTGTDAERQEASNRAEELINQKYAQKIKFAKEEYSIRKRLNEISHSSQQDLDEEYRLEAKIVQLDAERLNSSARFLRMGASADRNLLKREEQYENELNALKLQNQEKRLQLEEDGYDKELKMIDLSYEKMMDSIKKQEHALRESNYTDTGSEELTQEQIDAINDAYIVAEETRNRQLRDLEDKYRLEYLSSYGSFEEKKAVIAEQYDRKIAATSNEYQRKTLEKQKENALKSLEEQYSADYALIFADTSLLSNTLLAKAIENTQEAIKKATETDDIQKLTQLYARLREQLGEQSARSDGFFGGLVKGFRDLKRIMQDLESIDSNDKTALSNLLADKAQAIGAIKSNASMISNAFNELGDSLKSFEGTMGKVGDSLAEIGGMLSGLASNTDNIVTAFTSENKAEVIASGISSAVQLIAMVGDQIRANREAQEQWNATIRQCAHEYTMLQLEALNYKEANIFGVENPYQKAIDGARQYQASMEALLNMQKALTENGKVQTGTKKAVNWSNVGKGTAAGAGVGAAVGSIIPGLGTAIGTAIGAVVGGIAGLLSTRTIPVFETLTSQYGQLWDENYNLNQRMLADYNKLDDATKQLIDNWEEIRSKALEAEQQMKDNFSEIAGDIGSQLSDRLAQAFRNGDVYDAIDDFHDYMTGTIESIMEQLVFSSMFDGLFNELQDKMISSFGEGGDGDITDDLIWFTNTYGDRLSEYEDAMRQVQASLEEQGYDLWNATRRTASATGIAKADQDSVDELNGRMTAVQGHTYLISESVKVISASTLEIQNSVMTIQNLAADMADSLRSIKADMGSVKGSIDYMTTKGVKMLS